jgi:plasmid replication initiation protein
MSSSQTGQQLELLSQEELVVKSNRFITAKYDWSPTEHRIIAMMIAQLQKGDSSFDVQNVRIRDIREMSGTDSKDLYSRGEEICQKLLAQTIEVRTYNADGRREYEGYNLLSKCKYVEGSGVIRAKFNEDMRPFLLELRRRFTMYGLQYVMRLRSQYSIRIYETLKMREGLGFNRMTIDDLREMLMITDKYTGSFSQVKAKVLEPARKEIKEKCDVYFTYHVEREGRTPVAINFMIHSNDDVEPAMDPDEIDQLEAARGTSGEAQARALPEGASGTRPERPSPSREHAAADATAEAGERRPPRLDGYEMFLKELSQDDLSATTDAELKAMREKAEAHVDEQNPDAGAAVRASEVYRTLLRLWRER